MRKILTLILIHLMVLSAAKADSLFKPESGCARSFVYRNRTYPVDSSRKLDGEGLRFVLKKQPESEELLNNYQSRLKSSFIPAYVSTLGIAMAVAGPLYADSKETQLGKRDTRNIFLFSGIFLAVAGYAYGQFAINNKEKVLEKAVETYNGKVTDPEKLSVGLTPTSSGTGGEIKATVPF